MLSNRRHFELVTETDIRVARDSLADAIEPQVRELIDRAEAALGKMERKEKALSSKVSRYSRAMISDERSDGRL